MRHAVLALFAVAAVLLAFRPYVARAEGEAELRLSAVEQRAKALEAEVEYLRARETTLTKAVLAHGSAAADLSATAAEARAAGFEAAAVPAASRQALLAGLERTARSLSSASPAVTQVEAALLKKAIDARPK